MLIRNVDDNETGISYFQNGTVELYYNGVKKLDTGSHGIDIVDELHVEGATPHVTLKRTNNAILPSLRFKGSGGTEGANIKFDGTSGTTNTLIFQTYDGVSLAERFRVTTTGANILGPLQVGASNTDATITTNGTGDLTLSTNNGTNSGTIQIQDGTNGDIRIEPNGNGDILMLLDGQVGIGSVSGPDTALHIKETDATITLQRVGDTNTPGINFQSNGGNVRAKIYMDGTNGTNKEIVFQNMNGDASGNMEERFRVTLSGAKVTGNFEVTGAQVDFGGLPTSDPSVAGRLWNDSGAVKVSAG